MDTEIHRYTTNTSDQNAAVPAAAKMVAKKAMISCEMARYFNPRYLQEFSIFFRSVKSFRNLSIFCVRNQNAER